MPGVTPSSTAHGGTIIAHTDDSGRETTDLRIVRVPVRKMLFYFRMNILKEKHNNIVQYTILLTFVILVVLLTFGLTICAFALQNVITFFRSSPERLWCITRFPHFQIALSLITAC